jgi:hypothetical protein
LDITDKHVSLLPAHGRIRIPHTIGDPIIPSSGIQFPRHKGLGVLTRGHTRANNWPIGEKLPVNFDLTFPAGPFASQPLVPTCERPVEEFTGVVDAFVSLCFGTITKTLPWA